METAQEFQVIPLSALRESKTNPRRHFNPTAFEELVKSIRTHGVLVPLIVRGFGREGDERTYEIVCGARRYRAAKKASVKDVPVRIQPLTDLQVLEIQVIENLQREDVHPLDEGAGYRVLIEKTGHDVATIAAKVDKSISYIYQRLKLTELIEPAKKACLEDKITAGHAILIARLQPGDQAEALKACFDRFDNYTKSVRHLGRWIEENIHLDLHAAPFPKADAMLFPAAGPCTTCPKRTGFTPDLFPDIKKKDTCTDQHCFEKKISAFIARRKAEFHEKGKKILELSGEWHQGKRKDGLVPREGWEHAAKQRCGKATLGLIMDGRERGQVVTACADRTCKTHHIHTRPWTPSKAEQAKQKKEAQRVRTEGIVRRRVVEAILAKAPARLAVHDLRVVANAMYGRLWHDNQKALCVRRKWEPRKGQYGQKDYEAPARTAIAAMTEADLHRFLLEIALTPHISVSPHGGSRNGRELATVVKRYRINVGRIRREAKKGKVQTSAKR